MPDIQDRKRQHMEMASSKAAQSDRSPRWEDVHLVPTSTPELSISDVDLSTTFLGHRLKTPLVIVGMTGGHECALEINRNLAQAAAKLGLAIGTGSQRAALADPTLVPTYSVVRDHAPESVVIGNLGMCQLVPQGNEPAFGRDEIVSAVAMIDADLLAIHLNALEELIQPEGDRVMRGTRAAITNCVERSPVPVIAKETGAGMTRESALSLAACGVHGLDVGGVGGTSFARIEAWRARDAGDVRGSRLGQTFGDWGLPTALSIIEASAADLPLIATGGVRNGLHAAKAMALGASLVGVGGPAITAARDSVDAVIAEMTHFLEELRVAMTLIGVATIAELATHEPVLTGHAADWLGARGIRWPPITPTRLNTAP